MVKNTFIGIASKSCSFAPRSASAPPRSSSRPAEKQRRRAVGTQQAAAERGEAGPEPGKSLVSGPTEDRGATGPSKAGHGGVMSAIASHGASSSTQLPADQMSGAEGSESEGPCSALVDMIKQECAFLCIRGFVLHEKRKVNSRRPEAVEQCLRVFIRGLPLVKRSKWLIPLSYAVLAALRRCGCDCHVKKDGLYLHGPDDGSIVRVEFSPVRSKP